MRPKNFFVAGVMLGAVACTDAASSGSTARRLISLHDVTTEIAVAIGAGDRLVGVCDGVDLAEDVLERLRGVPRVGSFESIALAKPDVVVGLAVVGEQDPELVLRLKEAGVVVELFDPRTLEDVGRIARAIGALVEAPRLSDGVVGAIEEAARAKKSSGPAVDVFVYDCCDPPFTAGGQTVLSDLLRRAGGRNVFEKIDNDWMNVSWEAVIAEKPQLIVVHAYRYEDQADTPAKLKMLREIPTLAGVPTVVLPLRFSLGGLGSLEGLARLSSAIAERRREK